MENLSSFSTKELLGMAIKGEIDSKEVYSKLERKVENPILKDKFKMLASEEEKHRIILEQFFKALFYNENIPIPKISFEPATPFVEIIHQAMNFEKESQKFYLEISKRFEDERKNILEYLNKVEETHFLILKNEYEMAQEFEDYDKMKEFDKIVT